MTGRVPGAYIQGSIRYGGPAMQKPRENQTWSEQTGISVDDVIDANRGEIEAMRRGYKPAWPDTTTDVLAETLRVAVETYEATGRPIHSTDLATPLGATPGAVKNRLRRLADMGLIRKTGNHHGKGSGYIPTGRGTAW